MVDLAGRDLSKNACHGAKPRSDILARDDGVVAWRFWHVGRAGWPADALVAPIASLHLVRPGETVTVFDKVTEARCVTSSHPAPMFACRCGIRGMYDLRRLVALMRHLGPRYCAHAAIGRVKLWGRMQDEANDDDWPGVVRGQYASIVTTSPLYLSPVLDTAEARALTNRYGVTVVHGARRYPTDPLRTLAAWLDAVGGS